MVVDDKKVTQRRVYPTFAEGYKLLECVGRGSEGSVWRATCIPIKKDVAIKIIDLESLPSSSISEIHQQIQAMYSCSMHPHVVRYYTSFVHGTSLWCVMKYLSGGSCNDIMRLCHPHGLDEHAIKIILKDTLKALDYFHSNGRIHRDIKAGNIIISETGSVQVADFGVSGSLLVEQLRTTLCGSPCWMAPEVMLRAWPQGREQSDGYDYAVDIWSLGITALELAKGRPPFAEFAPSRVFSMVVQNPPPALDDDRSTGPLGRKFSSAFKDFVSHCLQKDPTLRPSAAKLLKHKFFKGKKAREYLVNTVLADLPSVSERSTIMAIPQTLPQMMPSGAPDKINWNFSEDQEGDPLALLAASLESVTLFGTSTTSQQSMEDTKSEGSSVSEAEFFNDEWFVAPTPMNTVQGKDFNDDEVEEFPLSHFNVPKSAPTPANTMQGSDFAEEKFDEFPSTSTLSMQPPPTPANTMQGQDFARESFDAFPAIILPAPTPANTMQSADFEEEVFEDFPISSMIPPPTPTNTMQSVHFINEKYDDLSFASEYEEEDEDDD